MSQPKNYNQLIIQVSLQEFSFVIKDILSQDHLEFQSDILQATLPIEDQLEVIFSKYDSLHQDYEDILVLHHNALNTFVPQAVFDENTLGGYLQYSTKVFSTDFFAYDELDLYQMNNVYIPYIAINNFLLDKFGSFTYQNIHTSLVSHLLRENPNHSETVVYAHIQENRFELVVLNNDQLLLFNSFEYQTAEDFIYYTLFVFEQLELNPDQHVLTLLGDTDHNTSLYQIAYKYIRNVSIKTWKTKLENTTNNSFNTHYTLFQS